MLFGNQKINHAERHFHFGGEFEICAVEVQTEAHLTLKVVLVEFYQHFVGALGLFLLIGNQVQAILHASNDINAHIVLFSAMAEP